MRNVSLCLAVILLTVIVQAEGGMITQALPYGGKPSFTQPLIFDEFDDQGGTLQLLSIQVIQWMSVDGGQIVIDNDGVDAAIGSFIFGALGSITSLDVALLDISSQPVIAQLSAAYSDPAVNLAGNVGDGTGDHDPNAPDGMQYNGQLQTDADDGFIDPGDWNQYIGTGTFQIDATVATAANFSGVGGVEVSYVPVDAIGEVMVIYNFVPEPATMCMLAIGGVAMLRRRNRK